MSQINVTSNLYVIAICIIACSAYFGILTLNMTLYVLDHFCTKVFQVSLGLANGNGINIYKNLFI